LKSPDGRWIEVYAPLPKQVFQYSIEINMKRMVVGLNRGIRASTLQYSIEINMVRCIHRHQPQLTTSFNDSPEITTVEISWFWLRHTSEISIFL